MADNLDAQTTDLRQGFVKHMLGPRGGLFALGVFAGMAIMYYFMTATLISEMQTNHKKQIDALTSSHQAQVERLETRVTNLEDENRRIRQRLEQIAFKDMEE